MKTKRTLYPNRSGSRYYTVKLNEEASQRRITQEGPWFVARSYLSVRIWEPNFVPNKSQIKSTAIWLILTQLPTEFYDALILKKVGKKIDRLLKVDTCTSSTLRGRNARICVQVPLNTPLKTMVTNENHHQLIIYEGYDFLCKSCGRLGHTTSCPFTNTLVMKEAEKSPISKQPKQDEEWITVEFAKKRKQPKTPTNGKQGTIPSTQNVKVKMFDAKSSKFLKTWDFQYTVPLQNLNGGQRLGKLPQTQPPNGAGQKNGPKLRHHPVDQKQREI